jgi:pantoate--beta-alanine ligase
MRIIRHIDALRAARTALTGPLALVPTMGALHRGHLALISQARLLAGPSGHLWVSIFVNPIQFDRAEDLATYPRPLDADLESCRAAGVDLVFLPEPADLYAHDRSVEVVEKSLSNTLCGAARPGHFTGVCTVVLKLFNLVEPSAAVFGKKDFQQLAIIRRMVRDLDVPVAIHAGETEREPDGLALSSRNVRLSTAARAAAPLLYQALLAARETGGPAATKLAAARAVLAAARPAPRIDYLALVDAESLQPIDTLERPAVLAAAVFFGEVRLIDNIQIDPTPSHP